MQLRSYSTFSDNTRPPRRRILMCRHFTQPNSKSVLLVLVWTIFVGFINGSFNASPHYTISRLHSNRSILLYITVLLFVFQAILMICYPLGGFVADVYFGRYKVIKSSLIAITLSILITWFVVIWAIQLDVNKHMFCGRRLCMLLVF